VTIARRLLVVLLAGLVLPACTKDDGAGPTVLAAFTPLAEVARQVGGDRVKVVDLTPAGADAHGSRTVLRGLTGQPEVLVFLGHGFQPAVEELASSFKGATVDGLDGLPVVDDDPHVWLDPTMLSRVVGSVQEALGDADPRHRDDYETNAARYLVTLSNLDRQLTAGLAECDRNVVVTAHAAWRYFTSRYRLEQEPLAGVAAGEPTPARMAELTALVRDAGVTTVFREPRVPPGPITALAAATGARVATLDPIEGPGGTYLSRMRRNLAVLRTALGCA
jgi:zinc transport system substrate-binding protein